jgi:hypothetical protein
MKKTAAVLSFALAMGSIATFASPAMAAAPTVTAIEGPSGQAVGSVAGGYDVLVAGEDFCNGSTADVTSVNIGDIALTNLSVLCDVSGTTDTLQASVSPQALANREIGRKLVVVETSQGTNSNQVYFGFIPEVDESYSTSELVELGDLFSRSQRQPIVRSRTAPFTVTGTDYLTGQPYTYITNYDYLQGLDCVNPSSNSMEERCGAYSHEADLGQAFHPGALEPVEIRGGLETRFQMSSLADSSQAPISVDTSNGTLGFDSWLDGRTVTELYSNLDCDPNDARDDDLSPDNFFDSGDGDGAKYTFCAGFGPDIYSEPFVADAGQSLAFEWAAMGVSDDYAVYAYLVEVDPNSGAIPVTATAANHELVMFNSGHRSGPSDWQTSTVDVTDGGTYRFRFINGTYDGTGGYALGSLFYLNSFFLAGDTNEITFGEFDDVVYDPADPSASAVVAITASSTAGGQPTVITLTPSICTVATSSPSLAQYNVTLVSSPGTCILQASQGQTGTYAPAASVITAFEVYAAAQAPAAPTLLSATGLSQTSLGVDFQAGPSGGQTITGYEYSLDGGAWVAISPAPTNSFTIQGLAAGTSYNVQIRALNATGPGSVSNTVVGTTLGTSSPAGGTPVVEPYNGPEITSIVPKIVKTEGGETVVVVGRRLGAAVDLTIGGIKVTMITPTETGFKFVMPAGTAGLKDMLYRYDGGASFTVLGALEAIAPIIVQPETGGSTENPAPKPWSAVGVANMFAPGSAVVNSRVRAQVVAMLRQYGSIATKVECSGFTMGPTVLRVDAALSKARATAVCGLIKQLRPRLTVVRAVGKQETKLGGVVRRVEVLFTRG